LRPRGSLRPHDPVPAGSGGAPGVGVLDLGLVHRKDKSARANWWMVWRRIAGGLPYAERQVIG